jgi:hypothetical protein
MSTEYSNERARSALAFPPTTPSAAAPERQHPLLYLGGQVLGCGVLVMSFLWVAAGIVWGWRCLLAGMH